MACLVWAMVQVQHPGSTVLHISRAIYISWHGKSKQKTVTDIFFCCFLFSLLAVRSLNDQLMFLERAFIDPLGLPGRPFYR